MLNNFWANSKTICTLFGSQVIIFKESVLLPYEHKGTKQNHKNNDGFQTDFALPHLPQWCKVITGVWQ